MLASLHIVTILVIKNKNLDMLMCTHIFTLLQTRKIAIFFLVWSKEKTLWSQFKFSTLLGPFTCLPILWKPRVYLLRWPTRFTYNKIDKFFVGFWGSFLRWYSEILTDLKWTPWKQRANLSYTGAEKKYPPIWRF